VQSPQSSFLRNRRVVDGKCNSEGDIGFVPRASATKILGIARAIAPIEATYPVTESPPRCINSGGARAGLLVPFSLQRASNAVGDAALAFYVKAKNVHISIDVIGDKSLDSLVEGSDNGGLRHIAILTLT
jgi:hypothetical protein